MSTLNDTVPYVLKTNGSISIYVRGECFTVDKDHVNYNKIVESLKQGTATPSSIDSLINGLKNEIKSYVGNGDVKIEDGMVTFFGKQLHNTLTTRIITMMREGFKVDHMVRFLENLVQNPSNRALNELYTFLENKGLPITEDGHFIAYKAVKNNYYDIYTGKTYLNTVGSTITMPRVLVDEVYERDCSTGLHCGALDYVTQYGAFAKGQAPSPTGNRLLLVKVNPADVVSVPQYESHPKIRVCKYEVVDEIKDIVKELEKSVVGKSAQPIQPDAPSKEDLKKALDEELAEREMKRSSTGKTPQRPSDPDWDNYDLGWQHAETDLDEGNDYGESRDYGLMGDYRLGYNDNFNGRGYNNPNAEDDGTCCGDCSCCGCGSHTDHDEINLDGAEELPTEDADYSIGYTLGQDDFRCSGTAGYEESLDIDASDSLKQGYHDGWQDASNS